MGCKTHLWSGLCFVSASRGAVLRRRLAGRSERSCTGLDQSSAVGAGYHSDNMREQGLNLMPPPAVDTEASARLHQFAARMVTDGRCSTVRRHYSAVVGTGVGLGCLRSSDLLIESVVLASDPVVMRAVIEQVDRFAALDDRTAGSVELYGDYVLLLIENSNGTFSVAVDTISSATDNQPINDVLLARSKFTS